MFGFKKKHFRLVMGIAAAVMPFVFFATPLSPWQNSGRVLMLTQEFIYPLEYLWHTVGHRGHELLSTYAVLVGTAQENVQLKKENFLLRTRMIDYEHQLQEANRLREMLKFSQVSSREITVAEVVGSTSPTPFQSIRISRGSNEQLRVGMPVIAPQGVVGKILRVGYAFADVQLLVDSNFHLDVMVERTRIRGVLKGLSDSRCRLLLHRRADIKIGDVIVTSGMSGSFPKGLVVGAVVRISYDSDNVAQVVTLSPQVDYHRIEEVVVMHAVDPSVETIKETVGEAWMEDVISRRSSPAH